MMLPAFLFGSIVNRPTNPQTAAKQWLDEIADRVLGVDTTNYSHAQLEVLRKLADKLQTKCYVSQWLIETRQEIPPYGSPEWETAYDAYLASE